ncbi:molybdopterin molybdotransferase MoeA [Oricola cellulosilytica]|uniref:Molybdopterin molybdenumtransferase n=1 Tax=Oricola cellulosilytica TaxID=1429082 RepID=A0A4R0P7B5_9HYPH|nr:gephyrin-like molybdotransferase Glp [Oricola cellulosilytica]TCD11819.1 molybdopterin molybdenumtransferase MoeA [Oricola cellulosilytica]
MTDRGGRRKLLDDCFLHDTDRMRHADVMALLRKRLACVASVKIVPLAVAHRRISARDVVANRPVPMHENSAVDGYAFNHADYAENAGKLSLGGRLAAGDTEARDLKQGECVRIFTGAVMPDGADTVAMQEDCRIEGEMILIPEGLKAGANCRHSGEDLATGETVVPAGQIIRAQDIAALASMGLAEIQVRSRLRVAVMSTGNELVAPGGTIRHGQVFDSNAIMLRTLVESLGGLVTDIGIVEDRAERIESALAEAAKSHDLVITSGGASRGEEDHMLAALDRLGKRHLWQIAIKPGRPMMFGQIGDCVVLSLPGNPVAAFVCFLLYVRTAMDALAGADHRDPVRYPLPAAFDIPKKKRDRREFLRGHLVPKTADGALTVAKYPQDGSGLISGLRAADGLIELGEEVTSVRRGDMVDFIPFAEFGVV